MASLDLEFFTCCLLLTIATPLVNTRGIYKNPERQAEIDQEIHHTQSGDGDNEMGHVSNKFENETFDALKDSGSKILQHGTDLHGHEKPKDDTGDLNNAGNAISENYDNDTSKSEAVRGSKASQHGTKLSQNTSAIDQTNDGENVTRAVFDNNDNDTSKSETVPGSKENQHITELTQNTSAKEQTSEGENTIRGILGNNDNGTSSYGSENLSPSEVDRHDKQLPGSTVDRSGNGLPRSEVNKHGEEFLEELHGKLNVKNSVNGTSSVADASGMPDGSRGKDKKHPNHGRLEQSSHHRPA